MYKHKKWRHKSMSENRQPKKLIVKRDQTTSGKHLELYHSPTSIINDALATLGNETAKLRIKSHNNSAPLNLNELKALNETVRSLLQAEKQQADLLKSAELTKKLAKMSDAELLEFAKSAIENEQPTTEQLNPSEDPND